MSENLCSIKKIGGGEETSPMYYVNGTYYCSRSSPLQIQVTGLNKVKTVIICWKWSSFSFIIWEYGKSSYTFYNGNASTVLTATWIDDNTIRITTTESSTATVIGLVFCGEEASAL